MGRGEAVSAAVPDDPGAYYRPRRLELKDHDPGWLALYTAEVPGLREAIGDGLEALEHVGSTAVPGLAAKPIIDILATVRAWTGADEMVQRLAAIEYLYTAESEADDPERKVFRKGPADLGLLRTHQLHVTLRHSHYARRLVAFRDHLRAHPTEMAAYGTLKADLVRRHATDSRAYTAAKSEFVHRIERLAGIDGPLA